MGASEVRIEVNAKINLESLATWPPENVEALMLGIAKVVAVQQLVRRPSGGGGENKL